MNAIGPVEPGDGATPLTPRDAPDPDRPGPAPGPVRRQRLALAVAGVVALAAAAAYGYATRHAPPPGPPEPPTPWPAQVTWITYTGAAAPSGRDSQTLTFRFRVTVTHGPPVTVLHLTQPYQGMDAATAPRLPVTVTSGTTRQLTVHMFVRNCSELPPEAAFPFFDVTLRNTRAMQTWSFILGGRYPSDLSSAIRRACPTTAMPRDQPGTGTAGSHHAKHTESS